MSDSTVPPAQHQDVSITALLTQNDTINRKLSVKYSANLSYLRRINTTMKQWFAAGLFLLLCAGITTALFVYPLESTTELPPLIIMPITFTIFAIPPLTLAIVTSRIIARHAVWGRLLEQHRKMIADTRRFIGIWYVGHPQSGIPTYEILRRFQDLLYDTAVYSMLRDVTKNHTGQTIFANMDADSTVHRFKIDAEKKLVHKMLVDYAAFYEEHRSIELHTILHDIGKPALGIMSESGIDCGHTFDVK